MKTLIIVILILVCVLTTPLSLKRMLDRKQGNSKSRPAHLENSSSPLNSESSVSISTSADVSSAFSTQAIAPGAAQASSDSDNTPGMPGAGFDLQAYLTRSIERIVKDSIRATRENPAETRFLVSFAAAAGKAALRRKQLESAGEHIPPFLIASITEACNLRCAGCYAHARADSHLTSESAGTHCSADIGDTDAAPASDAACYAQPPLSTADWERIFREAEDLGISFIFLVGGEPLLNSEVIELAGSHPKILFPIITNGILIDDAYLRLFDRCRNLLPVISIEGESTRTDSRRGAGIYAQLQIRMQKLASLCIPFGVSITVTTENLLEVTNAGFPEELRAHGCQMMLYIEYVSTGGPDASDAHLEPGEVDSLPKPDASDAHLEPGEADRALMELRLQALRQEYEDIVFLAFPGDEKAFGGCLAAGRGFFHISASGNAEPCPFAPFSDINLRNTTVREALHSRLFAQLDAHDMLQDDHTGGCALSHKGAELQVLLLEKSRQTHCEKHQIIVGLP